MTQMAVQNNGSRAVSQPRTALCFTPRFDIWENDEEYVLTGDLPGVDPQDLDVRYENQELTIYGKVGPRNYNCAYFAEEYGVGDFRRSFTVGDMIDEAIITASIKDGVLTVHLPKRAEARPRKIAIKSG